jgi:hypothetical protein
LAAMDKPSSGPHETAPSRELKLINTHHPRNYCARFGYDAYTRLPAFIPLPIQ